MRKRCVCILLSNLMHLYGRTDPMNGPHEKGNYIIRSGCAHNVSKIAGDRINGVVGNKYPTSSRTFIFDCEIIEGPLFLFFPLLFLLFSSFHFAPADLRESYLALTLNHFLLFLFSKNLRACRREKVQGKVL